ncbi:hypothetical protein LWI28_000132 [Acer negundo]|uniref:Uncharacterized protein n=1 Tax=Acer negundo TaxID=4023 RepID=A0AAD5NR54_ACENE|nr:hypothetical protein LWI28_000132 [Acer negundo]
MFDEKSWAAGKILVNDLCKVVSTFPAREVHHSATNMFIPCFGMMFHLLAKMNDKKFFNVSTPAAGSLLAPYFNRLKQSIGFWHRPTASNGLMLRFTNYMCNASTAFPHPWAFDQDHVAIASKSTFVASLFESMFMVEVPGGLVLLERNAHIQQLLERKHTYARDRHNEFNYWTDPVQTSSLLLPRLGHLSLNRSHSTRPLINSSTTQMCLHPVPILFQRTFKMLESLRSMLLAPISSTMLLLLDELESLASDRSGMSPLMFSKTDRGDLTPQL